jgi:hypothetical protein
LEYIKSDKARPLSETFFKQRWDPRRRENLFGGLATILLSLARIPAPRIGSWIFHDDGTISLTNRPLSCGLVIHESEGAKRIVQQTYTATEPYIADLLLSHDHRFLAQPNAVVNKTDGLVQIGVATVLRAISHHFFDYSTRDGPFILAPTDLHQSNLLVDEDWNLKYLIDLEWFCTQPIHMCHAPRWLTGRSLDEIADEALNEYNIERIEFMRILGKVEDEYRRKNPSLPSLVEAMDSGWRTGRVWYSLALTSVNTGYFMLVNHLLKKYGLNTDKGQEMLRKISCLWRPDSATVLQQKLTDKSRYDEQLKVLFSISTE